MTRQELLDRLETILEAAEQRERLGIKNLIEDIRREGIIDIQIPEEDVERR